MKPFLILVLDGDPDRRERLMALLRAAHFEPVAAGDPDTAVEALQSGGFGAMLLDLTLSWLDAGALRHALAGDGATPDSLEEAERRHLALVLRHTAGNKRKAAHVLGISRSTLLNKVRKYGLER
jgi:DNA-binding NtrC family response regulator